MEPLIALDDIGKKYWQLQEQAMLLKSLIPGRSSRKIERWALRHLDVSVHKGETVGIIGHNGAGKTTLLRLLAGVTRPSEGHLRIAGRIAPLIGVGVGFHQEMTGRENVVVNGMLLGLDRQQIAARFDEIVAFAELEEFIDTPVKFYSSGMFMRLGFAVAVHVDPDVMLVDEVLAVGDVAFQLKCFDRMRQLQSGGTTILFVSHSMHAVRLLCPRAVLIRHGRLEFDGPSEEAISHHHHLLSVDSRELDGDTPGPADPSIDHPAASVAWRRMSTPRGENHHPEPGEAVHIEVGIRFHAVVEHPNTTFRVTSEEGIVCYSMQTRLGQEWRTFQPGDEAEVAVDFTARLGGGTYRLTLTVTDRKGLDVVVNDPTGVVMYVAPRLGSGGFADLEASVSSGGFDLTQHDPLLIHGTPEPGTAPR
jgi:ABC-type polysaccharide/polyol phosphate transport system ATPase subunit